MKLNALIKEYEKTLIFGNTQQVRVYESKKKDLLSFMGAFLLEEITAETCSNYIKNLMDKGNKAATIRTKYSYLKSLLTYAYQNGYIKNMPYIKSVKKEQKEKDFLNVKQILKMLKWCREHQEPELKKIILIGFYTGLRIDNILKLTSKNIDKNYIRIWINKNSNPQSIPIKKRLQTILNDDFTGFKSNYQHIYYIFNLMKKDLKLDAGITIHTLRHTFCSRCIEKGINLRVVQQLAGHKNINTTIQYTHIKNKTLEEAINLL